MVLNVAICYSQVLSGVGGEGGYKGPFERGYQSTTYCGNSPESWVRGNAFLNKKTGFLTITINLETDATHAGPKGQIVVRVYDNAGNTLAKVASEEIGRGGKAPGRFEESIFSASFDLGTDVGSKAATMTVKANCTGSIDRWFNIKLETLQDAFKIFHIE